jgi:hypothetical protein
VKRKQLTLILAVALISATVTWLSFSAFHVRQEGNDEGTQSTETAGKNISPILPGLIPNASMQTEQTNRFDLSKLSADEAKNLSVESVFQRSENAEQIYDLSETWPKGSIRSQCAREEGAWLFCYTAGASQRALADPLELSNAQRMNHETVLRFAKTFCRSFPAIDARRSRDVQIAQNQTQTQPVNRDPYDVMFTELLAISVTSPIQERLAQATLAKAFQQSFCLRQAMPEVFIGLESLGYRKHLSFVSLIDELSSNEVVAAGTLAAELAACRNGPACGPMGFMTMQVCQGLKNCKPEQSLFDIRRARTTPRVFQAAMDIANHYGSDELPSKK